MSDVQDSPEDLKKALESAVKYIVTMRQVIYSSVPGVAEAARNRLNSDGSAFCSDMQKVKSVEY